MKDVDAWLSNNEDRLERVSIADWMEKAPAFSIGFSINTQLFLRFILRYSLDSMNRIPARTQQDDYDITEL